MLDVDLSKLNRELLAELGNADLGDYVIDLAWSPDASKLAAVTGEGSVFLIDGQRGSACFEFIGQHAGGANSLSWRCDGAEFATAGHDGVAKIWDGSSGRELSSLEAGDSWVAKVVYSPRRNVLATAAGRHLKLWNEQREAFYESSDHSREYGHSYRLILPYRGCCWEFTSRREGFGCSGDTLYEMISGS